MKNSTIFIVNMVKFISSHISWKFITLFMLLQTTPNCANRVYYASNQPNYDSFDGDYYRGKERPIIYAYDVDNNLATSSSHSSSNNPFYLNNLKCADLRFLWKQAEKLFKNAQFADTITNRLINRNPFFVYKIMMKIMDNYRHNYDNPSTLFVSSSSLSSSSSSFANPSSSPRKTIVTDSKSLHSNSDHHQSEDKLIYDHPDDSRKSTHSPASSSSSSPSSSHLTAGKLEAAGFGRIVDTYEPLSSSSLDDDNNMISDSSKKEDSQFFPSGSWADQPIDLS